MPSAPKDDAVGRAWSWALTKAGITRERGPDSAALSAMSVMMPLSCRSTTLSARPRSGPRNRLVALTSVAIGARPSVSCIDQRAIFQRRHEFAGEDFLHFRRAGELIAL